MKFLSIILLMCCQWAMAIGTDAGGGGGAVVCRNPRGAIESAELLDLHEVKRKYGAKLRVPLGDSADEYIRYLEFRGLIETSVARSLSPSEKQKAINYFMTTMKQHFVMLPGMRPPRTNDFGNVPILPAGCAIEQLAFFNDRTLETIIDHEIWHRLDSLNQVALYAHEYFYRRFRLVGETNSMVVRRLVGMAFLETPRWHVRDGMPTEALWCSASPANGAGESSFYIYPGQNGSSILQFSKLMGRTTLSPTKVEVGTAISTSDFTMEGLSGLKVINPAAHLHETYPLQNSPFGAYRLRVQFEAGQPFTLTLVNHLGQKLQVGTVQSCQMGKLTDLDKELNEYDYIDPDSQVPRDLLQQALGHYKRFYRKIRNRDYITVVDMAQHSSRKRFYLIDMRAGTVWSTFVTHGQGSDPDNDGWATLFSNEPSSRMTALGPFLATDFYSGMYGDSVRLDGLGFENSTCRFRGCMIAGWDLVRNLPIKQPRSWGSLHVPKIFGEAVAKAIKGHSLVYVGWEP